MDARRVEPEEIMDKCGWCGRTIRDGQPVFAVGGKKRPGTDTSDYEGAGIKFYMTTQECL